MPNTRTANAVRLEFAPGSLVQANLAGAAFSGDWLGVAGDEACGLDRLRRLDPVGREGLRFGEVRDFPLAELLDLPGTAEEEADLEGMAVADGFLWVVGSHGMKRKNAKPDRDHADNATRPAKVALDGNRRLLACLPIEPDAGGEPCLVRQAQDGRRALRLKGDSQTNLLTRALADDPLFGPYMSIPGKDNGFDIEGLAVDGRRMLLGLRGPVLRGWSALLEIAVESRGDQLRLAPLDDSGSLIRKHFLQLDGLGVRDLHFSDDDLYILAGPTMVLNGDIRVFKWPAARPLLAANRDPIRFEAALTESVSLPHGRGTNRAEAICEEGRITAVMLRPIGTLSMIRLMLHGAMGSLREAQSVERFEFEHMVVRPTLAPGRRGVKVAFDGEVTRMRTPIDFRVLARPLYLLMPRPHDSATDTAIDTAARPEGTGG